MRTRVLAFIAAQMSLCFCSYMANAQGVAINSTNADPHASAQLDVSSTTQGMLVPRMTAVQRGAISSPATGLLVYQTDGTTGFYFYNGSIWTSLNAYTTVPVANGGTGANLSATGGTGQYLKQATTGAAITVGTIPYSDITGTPAALNLTGPITSIGNATSVNAQTGTGSVFVMSASPSLTGVPTAPTAANGTNNTQIATTAFVLANASSVNLTGPITSVGNATSVADQTGTGSIFVMSASPSLTGVPTAPTAANGTNTTQIATTAFVLANAGSTSFAAPSPNSVTLAAPSGGVATTAMRSDATLQLSQAIVPTWTGTHTFTGGLTSTGTNAVSVSDDATATTVNVGSGAAVKTVTLGSTNGTSGTAIRSGSTGVNVNVSNNQPTNINTGTSTGQVNIGNNTNRTVIGSITTTIGAPGTSAGNGVRTASSRVIYNKPLTPIDLAVTNSPSVTQILDAGVFYYNNTLANVTLTLPSAQGAGGLVQALPGAAVGDIFTIQVSNYQTGNVIILAAGAGITLAGAPTSVRVPNNDTKIFSFRVTSITPNAETITVY